MSSPLAIAAVTAVLKDLLNNGLMDNDLAAVGSFSVTSAPPDRVTTGDTETNRLNLFLYHVAPNPGWRNAGQPARGAKGERLSNPPLALDLHYMLTAYGAQDLNAEILLGYAMEILHTYGSISRAAIRKSLGPGNPINVALIPADGQGRVAADLADQVENIKITPLYLNADELSRLWTAMQARYRPTMAYQVTTVLIQGTQPVVTALPVLQRGKDDSGIDSQPGLAAPPSAVPAIVGIELIAPDGGLRLAAELGDRLLITGSKLGGAGALAVFSHAQLGAPLVVAVDPASTSERVLVQLPAVDTGAAPASWPAWPAGRYALHLRIPRPGMADLTSDERGLDLAPRLFTAPQLAGAALSVRCYPRVLPKQRVELFVGSTPFKVDPIPLPTDTVGANIAGVSRSDLPVPVLLRVDGVASGVVRDRSARPARFDPQQLIAVPG